MSQQFVVIAKKEHLSQEEIVTTLTHENRAILKANQIYDLDFLDTVAVIEVEKGMYNRVYFRSRRCKHTNIQFNLTVSGEILPICEECNSPIIEREVVIEEK